MEKGATRLEFRPVGELTAPTRTARVHPRRQLERLAQSIERFGFNAPIVVSAAGEIVAGEARWLAARQLGRQTVPVAIVDHLAPRQVEAYRIADNRLAEESEWDEAILASIYRDLDLELAVEDIQALGFSNAEMDKLLAFGLPDPATNEDGKQVAAPPPVTRPGDTWLLGAHRLRCGSSTVPRDVERLLAGARPHLMVTDPPYGVEYDPSFRNEIVNRGKESARVGEVLNDDRADWREAWALFPGEVTYVWHAATKAYEVEASLRACRFETRAVIVWVKPNFAIGRGNYHWQHEPALYSVRKGGTGHWQGARDQSTTWNIDASGIENLATVHGTQKPVECMRRPMLNNSARGDVVYEPFGGSGSSIIAAETIGRRCYAMELSEAYCDVIVRRWQAFTGRSATLQGTGETFSVTSKSRLGFSH
ncbi:MAG: site-specific DNA-methyltransferase [Enhydrobacter sp.]|nr:site-specific DNA-methyltransferase [Enhydrobacter sp.]